MLTLFKNLLILALAGLTGSSIYLFAFVFIADNEISLQYLSVAFLLGICFEFIFKSIHKLHKQADITIIEYLFLDLNMFFGALAGFLFGVTGLIMFVAVPEFLFGQWLGDDKEIYYIILYTIMTGASVVYFSFWFHEGFYIYLKRRKLLTSH